MCWERKEKPGCCAGLGGSYFENWGSENNFDAASGCFVSSFLLHTQTIFPVCNNMGIAVLSYDLRT